jgi:predicted metalloprotease with PDZ domain
MKGIIRILILLACMTNLYAGEKNLSIHYDVDITKLEADSFYVNLSVQGWNADSAVFQFASTAPGTYEVEDAGRFVGGFRAFDASGKELSTYLRSTNQYVIRNSRSLSKIAYAMDDTYGSLLHSLPAPMGGTNIEKDNALVNGQMVFGFFKGHQSNPITVTYRFPKDWKIGTALEEKNGTYYAESYDQLVDSPVLLGNLSTAAIKIGGTKVDIYCYSQNGVLTADSLAVYLKTMLKAADKFIDGLPVKHYAFLFHFRKDIGMRFGAWEHSYSSEYYMPERPLQETAALLLSFTSHEFFHIITPLNIHSEIIAHFNFETPVPSQHLWLYEATTEWAAQMMQICGGIYSEKEFLDQLTQKMRRSDRFDTKVSLTELSLGSYGALRSQYENIYYKGALTVMLLDMRLLELSKGKMGLRDIIKKLSKQYGPKKSFPEKDFFDLFVKMTYPEINDFFSRYIKGAEPLPLKEFLAKAGYEYIPMSKTGKFRGTAGRFTPSFADSVVIAANVDSTDSVNLESGLRNGDVLLKLGYQGQSVSIMDPNAGRLFGSLQFTEPFSWVVRREGKELTLNGHAGRTEIIERHKIVPTEKVSKEQEEFRRWWLTYR